VLKKRVQYVNYNHTKSDTYEVESGVSEGGVSSHYFNLFINDLSLLLIAFTFQCADDVLVMKIIYDLSDFDILQNDLNRILEYTKENSITLNSDKSEHMRISMKNTIPIFILII
jgi:hypothetical protein